MTCGLQLTILSFQIYKHLLVVGSSVVVIGAVMIVGFLLELEVVAMTAD